MGLDLSCSVALIELHYGASRRNTPSMVLYCLTPDRQLIQTEAAEQKPADISA
jgi:hypothetical protein